MTIDTLTSYISSDCEHVEIVEMLKTIPKDILNNLTVSTAEPETILAYAGDDFKNLYILLNGTIKLSYELNTEFIYTFATVKSINILGETETFTNYPVYKSTLTCHTVCHYIVMPKALFISWMKSDINVLYQMTAHIAQKYTDQVRQDRTFLSAAGEDRFIYLLVKYYDALAQHDVCCISTSKESLADEVCVSIKTISRCISGLKKEGLISTQGHNIVIGKKQYEQLKEKYECLF